jgi:hypothetical protein
LAPNVDATISKPPATPESQIIGEAPTLATADRALLATASVFAWPPQQAASVQLNPAAAA